MIKNYHFATNSLSRGDGHLPLFIFLAIKEYINTPYLITKY